MSLILTQRPSIDKIYTDLDTTFPVLNNFKWQAAQNPVLYLMQRRDYEIVTITDAGGGNINVTINADLTLTPPVAGDLLYINSTGYVGTFVVVSFVVVLPNTIITLSTPFTINTFSGYANYNKLKPNYYIETTIMALDTVTQATILIGEQRNTPDPNGNARIDVAGLIVKKLRMFNANIYANNLLPYRDTYTYLKYYILYQEVYKDSIDSPVQDTDAGNPFFHYVTNSRRQIQLTNGTNLADYVPVAYNASTKAKFISDFKEPTWFGAAYPFDIGFIISEFITNKTMVRREKHINVSGVQVLISDTNLTPQNKEGEYRIMLEGTYAADIDKINLSIIVDGIAQEGYVNTQYYEEQAGPTYYSDVIPPIPPGFTPALITEERVIRIRQNCYDNPVYLAWKGFDGAWNYYLFYYRQTRVHESTVKAEVVRGIDDYESADTIQDYIQKEGKPKLIVGANDVDENDMNGLQKMLDSPKVQMFLGLTPFFVPIWQTVRIAPGSFEIIDTRDKVSDIQLTLQLNEVLTLSQ